MSDVVKNQGYRAQALGKDIVRDNPYALGCQSGFHWEWRNGFLEAFKDSGKGLVDSSRPEKPTLGEVFKLAVETSEDKRSDEAKAPMSKRERESIIFDLELQINQLKAQLTEQRRLLDEGEADTTLDICVTMKRAGRPVDAIKYYRDKYATTLREAKDFVDSLTW